MGNSKAENYIHALLEKNRSLGRLLLLEAVFGNRERSSIGEMVGIANLAAPQTEHEKRVLELRLNLKDTILALGNLARPPKIYSHHTEFKYGMKNRPESALVDSTIDSSSHYFASLEEESFLGIDHRRLFGLTLAWE